MGLNSLNLKNRAPICLILFLLQMPLQGQDIRFHPGDSLNPGNGFVEVQGLRTEHLSKWQEENPDWKTVLKVFPKELRLEKKGSILPMLGTYTLEGTLLRFLPRFPFREGLEYVVELAAPGNNTPLPVSFTVPQSSHQTSVFVEALYPDTGQVPANLLKLYLHFSGPMGLGNVYEHIRLLDENGVELEKPFLELEPALWDKQHRRLTLWFDPGRIKTDLQPNLAKGAPLRPGRCYKLMVSENLRDAFAQPLAHGFEKNFCCFEEDRTKPDPADWQVLAPQAGTLEALTIRFPEVMDKAGLENGISVLDAHDQPVAGKVLVSRAATQWDFFPEAPWEAGDYQLLLYSRMEDLAGNNLIRLFDTPLQGGAAEMPAQETFVVRFRVVHKK